MATSEKPLECSACGLFLDYDEPHSLFDCVEYLRGVAQAKDAQIAALAEACEAALEWHAGYPHGNAEFMRTTSDSLFKGLQAAIDKVREATDGS